MDSAEVVSLGFEQDLLDSLDSIQGKAAALYGRLEVERAIAWTVEELGELSQAIRREETEERLSEELGQLGAWVVCLSNICGVNLARALEDAFVEEAERQLEKHGAIRPYVPKTAGCE
jgi:NTP pyrophosphatase (non-canonical NTP hydrolase)